MTTVIDSMPEVEYHRNPSLSVSGAKKLLAPSCPAIYKYERDHGQGHKQAFDFGHAAHGLVLGVGEPVVVIDAPDWRSKAAREERDAAYAEHKVPVLTAEWQQIEGMAAAIKAHPVASELFAPGRGVAEQSLMWSDETHGVDRRARFDWFTGRAVVDYKTTISAEPRSIAKSVATYRYFMQDAWYRDAAVACELAEDPLFVFVFQQKTAPYTVTVVELDEVARDAGRRMNDKALRVFAECTATGEWPGYSSDVELISLPKWALYEVEDIA